MQSAGLSVKKDLKYQRRMRKSSRHCEHFPHNRYRKQPFLAYKNLKVECDITSCQGILTNLRGHGKAVAVELHA